VSGSSGVLDRTFKEAKRLCYAGLDEATLLKEVTERMQRAVPFHYCVHAHDPSSGFITRSVSSEPEVKEQAPVFLGYVNFEDKITPFTWMNEKRLAAVTLSEATDGRLERALRYRELFVLLGFKHEVRSVFTLGGDLWGSIDAMRERTSLDFTDREVEFFRRISPYFAAGLKAAALHQEALVGDNGDGGVPGC
jgi:hypothetical protein